MKKVLFIDRDGTIIIEPPDEQIDSLEKLEFYPKVIRNLHRIPSELDYELVMVTNQDGLGTDAFPEDTFWPTHNKMLRTLETEGIVFDDILIDRTFPADNAPTRKPGTGLLTEYIDGNYDFAKSFVIGDRLSDVQLAHNLGAKAIYISPDSHSDAALTTTNWDEIYHFLKLPARTASIHRQTKETDIHIELNLDGPGQADIRTGLGFFDHMLEQIARHAGCDLSISAKGDLHIDEHHTIEDVGLALGSAFKTALGDKRGLERYGFVLPMDEAEASVSLDFSGRSWLVWQADFQREKVGDMPTELFDHFFKSLSDMADLTLHIKVDGQNEHHKIEAIFKAFGRALKMALRRDPDRMDIPSTKGVL